MSVKAVVRIAAAVLLLSAFPLGSVAQGCDSISRPRVYDEEHPLIYEDAWDLWPYVFLDEDSNPTGYNVDLLRLIFDELDIPFCIKLKPTTQALADLSSGVSDLMLGMKAGFHDDYTRHYGKNVLHLFTHSVAYPKGTPRTVHREHDLATQQVIVHEGSFSHHLMMDNGWEMNAKPISDMALAMQMVSAEDSGQVLWNTMSLKWIIHHHRLKNMELSSVDMPSGEYCFMANDSVLLARLDSVYSSLKASGRLLALDRKWLNFDDGANSTLPSWLRHGAVAVGLLILLLAIGAFVVRAREMRATADGRLRLERLAIVLKACKTDIWTYDVEQERVTWYGDNPRSGQVIPLSTFVRRYRTEEADRLMEAIRRLIERETGEETLQLQVTDAASADIRYCIVALSVLKGERWGPVEIMATETDVTKELESRRNTTETMQRYKSVFNTSMVDMIYCDSEGYVMNLNQRAQQTFATTREEALRNRLNIKDLFDEDDILSYRHVTTLLTVEGPPLGKDVLRKEDTRYYELQTVPLFDEAQRPLGIYATGREMTEVKRTYSQAKKGLEGLKAAMKEQNAYVENINFAMRVGGVRIVTYSPENHIFTVYHRFGEAQYELTQQRCLSLTDGQSLPQVMRLMRAMDRRTTAMLYADVSTRLRVKGQMTARLQIQLFPTTDSDGQVTLYEGVCRDVTEMRHTEQLLRMETTKAQEVEQLKIKFLHNMCGAIRIPLDAVVKSAEMFEKEHPLADEPEHIETIKKQTAYLLSLVNDILFLSRLDAHMVEHTKRVTDIAAAIDSICQNTWSKGRRDGVVYEVENSYRQMMFNIDIINLGRILEQLIKNAVEHTSRGRVRVRYALVGENLIVGVDDTGEGISQDTLDHIFERFNTRQGKEGSTGLGLPICQELATLMGGRIDIRSQLGKGTSVWVTIPCDMADIVKD